MIAAPGVLESFARVLDYPRAGLDREIEACIRGLRSPSPEGAGALSQFQAAWRHTPLHELEEAYTSLFDLQPETSLHVGHHLFGEDSRRSAFLMRLKDAFQACGIDAESELPDHLCSLLRFVAARPDTEEARELVEECLLPVLSRLLDSAPLSASPYRWPLAALRTWLAAGARDAAAGGRRSAP